MIHHNIVEEIDLFAVLKLVMIVAFKLQILHGESPMATTVLNGFGKVQVVKMGSCGGQPLTCPQMWS